MDVDDALPSSPTSGNVGVKRIRAPAVTRQVKWHDIPNWYSRRDCPLLQLPNEILDRVFALETGLGVRDYVALAGVSRLFRTQLDDEVFEEVCVHHGLVNVDSDHFTPFKPNPVSSQIFSRNVGEWRVAPKVVSLRSIPSDAYKPRGHRANWSKAQYSVYRQERDIHLATQRLKRYKAAFEASEKRKKVLGTPILHPPVKEGESTRQVIGVVNGCRPGEKPFGSKGDQMIAHYDMSYFERPTFRGREWTRERLEELEKELANLIYEAEHPQDSMAEDAEKSDRQAEAQPWRVPSTPCDSEDESGGFEWDEDGNKVIHDFWPSIWREKAVSAIYAQRVNKATANEVYKITDPELATLRHVLASNPLNRQTPRRLFLKTAVEALAYRAHGGPLGHKIHVAKLTERQNKARETRRAKRTGDEEVTGYRQPKHWKGPAGSVGVRGVSGARGVSGPQHGQTDQI